MEYCDDESQSVLAYIENCTKTRKFFDKLIIFGDFDVDEQFTKNMIKFVDKQLNFELSFNFFKSKYTNFNDNFYYQKIIIFF